MFDTLPDTVDAAKYTLTMQKLDAYFTPLRDVDFEIFTFRKESQRSDETVDQYVTRLHKPASTCDFVDVDKEIKSVLIQNCSSKRLHRYAFVKVDVMLSQLLAKARAFESSEIHAAGMETSLQTPPISDDQAQAISSKHHSEPHQKKISQSCPPTTRSPHNRCNHCGGLIVLVPAPPKVKVVTHAARLIILHWYVIVANALSLAPHDKPSSKYLQMHRLPLMSVTLLVQKRNIFLQFK